MISKETIKLINNLIDVARITGIQEAQGSCDDYDYAEKVESEARHELLTHLDNINEVPKERRLKFSDLKDIEEVPNAKKTFISFADKLRMETAITAI